MRDETDLNGLKLTLDLKRGVDPDKLMAKLIKSRLWRTASAATLTSWSPVSPGSWACGRSCGSGPHSAPSVCAAAPGSTCRANASACTCSRAWRAILLDIDKAIHIIRSTEQEQEVVPNLMIGFGIDELQAEYVAEESNCAT